MQRTDAPPWVVGRPRGSAERATWRLIVSCRGRNRHGLPMDLASGPCEPTATGDVLAICHVGRALRALAHPRPDRRCAELKGIPGPIAVSATAPRTSTRHARPPRLGAITQGGVTARKLAVTGPGLRCVTPTAYDKQSLAFVSTHGIAARCGDRTSARDSERTARPRTIGCSRAEKSGRARCARQSLISAG